uniref:Hyaluronidase n=1 Tax=Hemiscolopendra marginata TaxID=943146 RepID=A0A646QD97_9MYRI
MCKMLQCNTLVEIFLWFVCLQAGTLICDDQKSGKSFKMIWNMQTSSCAKFGVNLDLEKFEIIQNSHGSFYGDKINIFYDIGKFPFINEKGLINGGLPQLGNLHNHLAQAHLDIKRIIPDKNFDGFAVLDWESWRPDWDTNWKPFNIYRNESINLAKKQFPTLNSTDILNIAKSQFEDKARLFMQTLIIEARKQRPKALWGYYGFPYCYNYNYLQKYCSKQIRTDNSEIQWLYNSSSALFPTIYISEKDQTNISNAVYVYGQIYESQRVSENLNIPIYPYAIVHYRDTLNYMTQIDLISTIGQAAALGLPGVVLWGRYRMVDDKAKCEKFEKYLTNTLGPTLKFIKMTVENYNSDYLSFDDSIPNDQWLEFILKYYFLI